MGKVESDLKMHYYQQIQPVKFVYLEMDEQ